MSGEAIDATGPLTPIAVETQEQAAALAAQIIRESGLSQDMVSPGSARFIAHQILADHVIEAQKQELDRVTGEMLRLQALHGDGRQAAPPALAAPRSLPQSQPSRPESVCAAEKHNARASLASNFVSQEVGLFADPPDHTESMARPDSALVGKGLTQAELVNQLVAVLRGEPATGLSRKSSTASALPATDAHRIHNELDSLTKDSRPTSMHVPNFTHLASQTVLSVEGKGGVIPSELPNMKGIHNLPSPERRRRSANAPRNVHEDLESTSTTLPPPPFAHKDPMEETVDWENVGQEVLGVLRDLHARQVEAEEEKVQLEEQLHVAMASPRRVEDDVFDSPVAPLDVGAIPYAVPQALPHLPQSLPHVSPASQPASQPYEEPPLPTSKATTPAVSRKSSAIPSPSHYPQKEDPYRAASSTAQSAIQGSLANPDYLVSPKAASAAAPEDNGDLPEGWKEYFAGEKPYYYNTATGKSHWKRPTAAAGKPLMINININVDKRKKRGDTSEDQAATPVGVAVGYSTPQAHNVPHVETIVHTQSTPQDPQSVTGVAPPLSHASNVVPHGSSPGAPLPPSARVSQVGSQRGSVTASGLGLSRGSYKVEGLTDQVELPTEGGSIAAPPSPNPHVAAAAALDAASQRETDPSVSPAHHTPHTTLSQAPLQGGLGGLTGLGTLDYTIDERNGSPIIVPPMNAVTTVVVEPVEGMETFLLV